MSTIASGNLGAVQNQAPSKGKAGHGNAGTAEEGGFASAIASLSGREDDGGRKGGRLSISGAGGHAQQEGGEADEPRVKLARHDRPALADALRKAGAEAPDEGEMPFEEKAVVVLDAASRQGRKIQGEGRDGGKVTARNPDEPATDDNEALDATAEAATVATDVGNLLEMLASPKAIPHDVAAKAVAAGVVQDGKAQTGSKTTAKVDARTDAATAKTDPSQAIDASDAGDVPQSDADQLFRLIRTDGKGRDLDMNINGAGDRATFRDANQAGPKGETVTVVDARRYIGLAQVGNSTAVTSAIAQDPEWAASLSATGGLSNSEAAATGKVVNTLKIQMHPIELGLVTATLRLHGDALVVSLQVETAEAYRQLTDDQDTIVRALRGQGFIVDQVSVQLSPADKSANAQQQGDGQGQQQFSSQPQAREGGNGRQSGGQQGTGTFGGEGLSYDVNTSDIASGSADARSVRSGSGSVYL